MATSFAISILAPLFFTLIIWIGVAIAARGVIGFPVWRSPACNACGHGLALRPESLRSPCPECGADLSVPNRVRYFARRRRYGRVALGIGVACSSVVILIGVRLLLFAFSPASIGSSTPIAKLSGLISSRANESWLAVTEVTNRLAAGNLADADLQSVLDALLTPADSPSDRMPIHGSMDLILEGRRRGLLDDDGLAAFGRRFTEPCQLSFPTTFRPPFDASLPPIQNDSFNAFSRAAALVRLELDGQEVPLRDYQGQPLSRIDSGSYGRVTLDGAPGAHTLIATFEETYVFGPDLSPGRYQPVKIVKERRVDVPLTFVAQSSPTWIQSITPTERRAEVKAACLATAVAIDRDASGERLLARADFRVLSVKDLGLAFEVFVVLEGKEYSVGEIAVISTGTTITTWGPDERAATLAPLTSPLPATATLRFRPKPELAEAIAGATAVWGETIDVEHLPVRSTPDRSGPTAPKPSGAETR